jgi:hypothetical protein
MQQTISTRRNGRRGAGTITIAGSLAQGSERGGHCWVFGQWLLGLRRLGWDVFFLDYEDEEAPLRPEDRERLARVLRGFGLQDGYALLAPAGRTSGRSRKDALAAVRDSAVLINVMGFLRDEEFLGAAARRVFLDIDPGYGQVWRELGLVDVLSGHDDFVTIGQNVGHPSCGVPDAGVSWITTLPPVVLDEWPPVVGGTDWTTVATWRGPWGPVTYGGQVLGSRVHEFRKFASLPVRVRPPYELALDIHLDESADLALLRANGWSLVDPTRAAGDPGAYRAYVQRSRAELCVAKNIYVEMRSGWFSDRSACYLASGKPVLAQDTGFTETLPAGEGLLAFSTMEDAIEAVGEIEGDYDRHAAAARRVAEEHFDSDRVLGELLSQLEVG